ncbi:conserved membrane hypothetical protein [Cupriavidus oxalaticus]|uniref:MFS transporter n=1 Tax=Cupriavidus oxalaticus TaxID=96344 RepID=A0A976BGP7_9BURK|nr:conserved membrane hypothetical protein [Cupriavidus oxalaticus]
MSVRIGDHRAHHQAVAVVAQGMTHVAQCTGGLALAVEPGIGIGLGLVRVVAALATLEVGAVVVVFVAAILAHEALVARPRLNQRAVDAEVLARQPVLLLRDGQHFVEELDHRIMLDQPFAVLGKDRGHPNCIVHRQPDEPAKQQVVLRLLHELAFGANAVEHLQQHGPQQLLRRDAGPAALNVGLVHLREQPVHLHQRQVGHSADRAQRVGLWHEIIQPPHGEQAFGEGVCAAHKCEVGWDPQINASPGCRADFRWRYFSSLLSYAKLRRCHLPAMATMTGCGFMLVCVSAELASAWRYPVFNVALIFIGASVAFSGSAADALLMRQVPRDAYGRTLGVQALIVGAAFPAGLFAAGVLLQFTDAFQAIATYNAGLCVAVALLLHLKLKKSGVQPNSPDWCNHS